MDAPDFSSTAGRAFAQQMAKKVRAPVVSAAAWEEFPSQL
jgi:hypothetical protein